MKTWCDNFSKQINTSKRISLCFIILSRHEEKRNTVSWIEVEEIGRGQIIIQQNDITM